MPGPAPKPAALRVIEGNPGKRHLPKQPKWAPLTDHAPDWMPPEAKAEWRRLSREFDRVPGLTQRPDRAAMIALCVEWDRYVSASRDLLAEGYTVEITNKRGAKQRVKNPKAQVAKDSLSALTTLWQRFGMTPSDRSRLDIPEGGDEHDPRLALLD